MIATQSYRGAPADDRRRFARRPDAAVVGAGGVRRCRSAATLESIATAAALTISLTRSAVSIHDAALDLLASSHAKLESVAITAFGAKRAEGGMDPETVLSATVDVHAGPATSSSSTPNPRASLRGCCMLAADGPESTLPESARSLASAAVRLSGSPSEWLDTINRSLPRGGAGVHAWGASFDPRTGVLLEVIGRRCEHGRGERDRHRTAERVQAAAAGALGRGNLRRAAAPVASRRLARGLHRGRARPHARLRDTRTAGSSASPALLVPALGHEALVHAQVPFDAIAGIVRIRRVDDHAAGSHPRT